VNLKDHFMSWIQEREKSKSLGRPFDRFKKFTLCSYPWLLDAANKSELLTHQNAVNHSRQQDLELMNFLNPGMGFQNLFFFIEVRREHILEDTLRIIVSGNANLKKKLRV
jgi:hypothetical protein